MKNLLTAIVILLTGATLNAQSHLSLADSVLGLPKNDLVTFVEKMRGIKPMKVENNDRVVYRVTNSEGQADFYIYKDSCLEVQITYKNATSYNNAAAIVKALSQKVISERTFYSRVTAGKQVFFSLDNAKLLIVAVDDHFFSGIKR